MAAAAAGRPTSKRRAALLVLVGAVVVVAAVAFVLEGGRVGAWRGAEGAGGSSRGRVSPSPSPSPAPQVKTPQAVEPPPRVEELRLVPQFEQPPDNKEKQQTTSPPMSPDATPGFPNPVLNPNPNPTSYNPTPAPTIAPTARQRRRHRTSPSGPTATTTANNNQTFPPLSPLHPSFHTGGPLNFPRVCAYTSPHLLRLILEWRDRVQIPALSSPAESKWLYFYVSSKVKGGGLADRFKGVVATFLLAIATQRAFAIHWRWPNDIQRYLTSSAAIPWASAPRAPEPGEGATLIYCENVADSGCAFPLPSSDERVYLLNTNLQWAEELWGDVRFRAGLQKLGMPASEFSEKNPGIDIRNFFGCLFHSLFYPVGGAREKFADISSRAAHLPLVCAQIRMGVGSERGWQDSNAYVVEKDLALSLIHI